MMKTGYKVCRMIPAVGGTASDVRIEQESVRTGPCPSYERMEHLLDRAAPDLLADRS